MATFPSSRVNTVRWHQNRLDEALDDMHANLVLGVADSGGTKATW